MITTTELEASRPRRVAACDHAHEPDALTTSAALAASVAPALASTADADALVCLPVTADRFEVSRAGVVVGFIDRVGPVFVVLTGAWYAAAVESRQVLTFDEAVAAFR